MGKNVFHFSSLLSLLRFLQQATVVLKNGLIFTHSVPSGCQAAGKPRRHTEVLPSAIAPCSTQADTIDQQCPKLGFPFSSSKESRSNFWLHS